MKPSYKHTCFFIVVFFLTLSVTAQVNVILRQPVSWHYTTDQLWEATVINSGNSTVSVNIVVKVLNSSGQHLLEGRAGGINLLKGVNTLNVSSVRPSYTFSSKADMNMKSGIFPYGKYTICMHIYDLSYTEVGIGCIEDFEINVLSPPQLFTPSDESEVLTSLPLLAWTPPSPIVSGLKVIYDVKLVEILNEQTAYDALRRNYSRMELKGLTTCYLQYPASALPIEEKKHYAWHVIARSDNYIIGETEIWRFTYIKPTYEAEKKPTIYSKVKTMRDGSFASLINGKLFFQFEEQYANSIITKFEIYNDEQKQVSKKCNQKLLKKSGDNRFEIDISRCSSFKAGIYYLEIENGKNTKYYLTFKVD
jgi:hypothetical protein